MTTPHLKLSEVSITALKRYAEMVSRFGRAINLVSRNGHRRYLGPSYPGLCSIALGRACACRHLARPWLGRGVSRHHHGGPDEGEPARCTLHPSLMPTYENACSCGRLHEPCPCPSKFCTSGSRMFRPRRHPWSPPVPWHRSATCAQWLIATSQRTGRDFS